MHTSAIYIHFTLHFILFPTIFITTNGVFCEEEFIQGIAMKRVEKTSHLHFYFHDILSGKNPTAVNIAGPRNSTKFGFGNTMMADDPLTEGPNLTSKLVGRAEGIYGRSAKHDVSLIMVMNFAFMVGKYNGSSISLLGRNHVFDDVREMPIVGGTGIFRSAHGYALAHTTWLDIKTGDAMVEYNVFVTHYSSLTT